ncbi:uncharacterized protein EV422DRAFT_524742 [Fimicolochytrium jonesii]|uniref:uncharacterized protein n=1 Tax=Fimicolochytrium jonesii TaxID=1396493 RepID=UPI0022FDC094|nr:uncharacterized protein EV422DRAFT_524742 [Fimicolochytrium jonesii]KAI8822618.1 hypothetical protein EV422DRAFT_524742 [Fimicolochytrium jonesii]
MPSFPSPPFLLALRAGNPLLPTIALDTPTVAKTFRSPTLSAFQCHHLSSSPQRQSPEATLLHSAGRPRRRAIPTPPTCTQRRANMYQGNPNQTPISLRPIKANIINPDLPLPLSRTPFPIAFNPLRLNWTNFKNYVWRQGRLQFNDWMSYWKINDKVSGHKAKDLATLAEQKYILMNEAFASGDEIELSKLVEESMLATLRKEIKAAKEIGGYRTWKAHGNFGKPKTLRIYILQADLGQGRIREIVQATVRVSVKQSIVWNDHRGNRISGDPNAVNDRITEYIVLQRTLPTADEVQVTGKQSKTQGWKIAGKVPAP